MEDGDLGNLLGGLKPEANLLTASIKMGIIVRIS